MNPAVQTGDQTKMARGGIGTKRIPACLATSLIGATLALANPLVAAAQGEQTWQTCIGAGTAPDERVSACSSLIDAKALELRPDLRSTHESLQQLGARAIAADRLDRFKF
jgi:hypothetical protein